MNLKCIFIVALICILSSCGFYRQNVVNVPLFHEKGQIQLGGHIGGTGYDGQVGLSISNKFAVLGNFNSNKKILIELRL